VISFLDKMISGFDRLILSVFSKDSLRKRDEEFKYEDPSSPLTKAIYEAADSVDTKATAVLQHLSIMIAVTALLLSQVGAGFFMWLFAIEALLYIALALCCLRLFMDQTLSTSFSSTQNVTTKEAILEFTAKATFFVSVILVFSVLIKLVAK